MPPSQIGWLVHSRESCLSSSLIKTITSLYSPDTQMTDTLLPGGKTILCFVLSQLLGLSTLVSVFLVMQREAQVK